MLFKKWISIGLITALPCMAGAQNIKLPSADFAPGWTREAKSLFFDGSGLFNYIDGGAELFLEFGFTDLRVQIYKKGSGELGLEVYRMSSPEAALGLYLMKSGKETPIPGIQARNTGDFYQVMILKSEYFILINNLNGSKILTPVMTRLAQKTLESIPGKKPTDLFSILPADNLLPGTKRLIRGPVALQSLYTLGSGDILQLKGKITACAGEYMDEKGDSFTRIIVPYPDEAGAQAAFKHLMENLDSYLKLKIQTSNRLVFRDYKNQFGEVKLDGRILKIKVDLREKPATFNDSSQ